jgi:UDP-GlcNAc:undecaprenyl-phosphate GlcNAc-1-phosphate transferase
VGTVVSAAAIGAAATVPVRRFALWTRLTDRPGGHKAHRRPTPFLGGLAILIATLPPVALQAENPAVRAVIMGAAVLALVGLIDDVRPLGPLPRLLVETLAALAVVLNGVQAPVTGTWLDIPLTTIWIVVVTNSYNLLDNMDGALGAVAVATGGMLAVTAFATGAPAAAVIPLALAGACAGFLVHNWTPARIFMGDCGSLFIGFAIACSAVLVFDGPGQAPAGLLLVTFVATVDTLVVVVSRRRAGRSVMSGGTDHVTHRLRRLGLSVSQTILALAAVAALTCGLACAVAVLALAPLLALALAAGSGLVLVVLLQGVDAYPAARPALQPSRR